ncbi:hypothetical protein R3W88_001081 [Solanum pinnatisectum]|uniref:MADS-box domain-containing protein n=1 Tax=Solanum pinnatisectum TaxID=50273 RepID=A0AAV9MJY1_9SOLN|nr:hypothetical protein R3W88_001081 [Solanum pinnatisectum]
MGSENSCLNIANTWIRIKEKQVELDNLEIIKETLTNETTGKTGMEEMWEQIKEFNPEDLKEFERQLDEVDLMLKNPHQLTYHFRVMAEKNTLGRQKISMAKTENEDDLYSSFSKRRETLYKKASDILGNMTLIIKEKQVELDNLEIIKETLTNETTDETGMEDIMEEMWEQIKKSNGENLKKKIESRLDEIDLMLKNVVASFVQAPKRNVN